MRAILTAMFILFAAFVPAKDICPIIVPPGEVHEVKYQIYTDRSDPANQCWRDLFTMGWLTLEAGKYDVPQRAGTIFVYWTIRPLPYEDRATGAYSEQWYVVCPGWDAYPGLWVCLFDDGLESGDTSSWDKTVGIKND